VEDRIYLQDSMSDCKSDAMPCVDLSCRLQLAFDNHASFLCSLT